MAEGNPSLVEQFLSASLLVGDLNAHDNSGRSLILITALLPEDFNASHIPGCSSILASAHDAVTSHKQLLLEYLLEREIIPRIDKIDALEMAGAVLLGSDANHEKFFIGFQYWRRALALRLMDTAGDCRPIYKMPTKSKRGQLSEWSTLEELDQIEKDAAQRVIQALLVRLRVASSLCWETLRDSCLRYFMDFLRMRTPHQCSLSQTLDVCWTVVDTIHSSQRPHEEEVLHSFSFIESWIIFRFKPSVESTSFDLHLLTSENLQKLVDLFLMEDLRNPISTAENETPAKMSLSHISHLVLMFKILTTAPPEMMTEEIMESLVELVRRDGRYQDGNLLHFVCLLLEEPHLPSIRFLVHLGANPNSRTSSRITEIFDVGNGCGVLHILAEKPESETRDAAARFLLDRAGAHLDMADEAGFTPADYWLRSNNQERHRLPDWLKEDVPMLMCLCSRVMRRHRVPHDESNTPADLIPFVALH